MPDLADWNKTGFSDRYAAGGLDVYGDNGAPIGSLGEALGRMGNNMNGTVANNIFNAEQAAIARSHASTEAQKERDWQTYMSNTAYRRAVSDMKAAGLNPAVLSGFNGSGSSASTGSAGSAGSPSATASARASSVIGALLKAAVSIALFHTAKVPAKP